MKEQKKERKRKRQQQGGPPAKRGAAAGLQTLRANEGCDDDNSDDEEEPPPPLHVFFDIEAMQPKEQHVANLVEAETEEDPRPVRFQREHCLRDFLEWLDTDPRGHVPSQCPCSQFSRV